ncbi:hypothetical protein K431DRAFT_285697 [Polychaeton citri CBS 116435]|uniref:Proteophosphoglycan 5 n=1 Tax=Polychaeton citri CBS 116435 TaxID=1314669 RepID=A0A9P4Q4S8_9PEZI|nr:hypothetical protein K431DRAFT_285697 [Polychaeton citri CBS 116435]
MADSPSPAVAISTGTGARQQAGTRRTPNNTPGQQKRHQNRGKKAQPQAMGVHHIDGAVSDSYAVPKPSPKPRKSTPRHNAPANGQRTHNGQQGHSKRQNYPMSMNGSMAPETPAKEQAYAGPTFQASPAPSSLPVPKFFSRSVPNAGSVGPLQERMAGEQTSEKESSPEPDVVAIDGLRSQTLRSPLDVFFKADKAEKEKRRATGALLSPQPTSASMSQQQLSYQSDSASGRKMFMQELDGPDDSDETDEPHDSPFGNPYHRVRMSPSAGPSTGSMEQVERDAYTNSLKQMLFNNGNSGRPPSQNLGRAPGSEPRRSDFATETPSPFNRLELSPGPPMMTRDQQAQHTLLYGNRDLSPLFKASRSEIYPQQPAGSQPQFAPYQQTQQSSPGNGAYYARASHNTMPPMSPSSGMPVQPQSPQAQGPATASPRLSSARDIGAMENDLRRMLKLNAVT